MKLSLFALPLVLASCGSTHFGLGSDASAAKSDSCCAGDCSDCQVAIEHLPNGHFLITGTDGQGAHCEVELACSAGHCEVVHSDCAGCCGGAPAVGK